MNASQRRVWRVLLIVLLVLVSLVWVLRDRLFERYETSVDRGFQGEAAFQHYYALGLMFESLGIEATQRARLRELPPTDRVLWVATTKRNASVDRILDWIASGGHAVIHAAAEEDRLIETLGISTFDEESADEDDHESQSRFASDRPDWPRLFHSLEDETDVLRTDGAEDAAWFLTVRYGAGTATVVADGAFLTNGSIAEHDHALIAWRLAHVDDATPAGIEILYRDPQPSVWALLTRRAWPVAISLLVLSLAGLVHAARRFGPMIRPQTRDRRRLSEHIRASGAFLWATENENRLLAAQRDALRHRFARGRNLSDSAFVARVSAQATDDDRARIEDALEARTLRDPRRFTQIVRTLEQLRRST